MKVSFDRRASSDLDDIRDQITLHSPKAAARLYDELRSACDRLSDFPMLGVPSFRGGLRELRTVRPYIIVYSVGADVVRIRRIVHGARLR